MRSKWRNLLKNYTQKRSDMLELVEEIVVVIEERLAKANVQLTAQEIELIKDVVHIVIDAQEERVNGIG